MRSLITSSIALIIYTVVMFAAYLLTIWFGQLPFLAFSSQFSLGFIAYISKRILQKQEKFSGQCK